VGGWHNKHLMRVAAAVVYDSLEDAFLVFEEDRVHELIEKLKPGADRRLQHRRLRLPGFKGLHLLPLPAAKDLRSPAGSLPPAGYRLSLGHLATRRSTWKNPPTACNPSSGSRKAGSKRSSPTARKTWRSPKTCSFRPGPGASPFRDPGGAAGEITRGVEAGTNPQGVKRGKRGKGEIAKKSSTHSFSPLPRFPFSSLFSADPAQQNRHRRRVNDLVGHASQDELAEAGAAVGGHGDEVKVPVPGMVDDLLGIIAVPDDGFYLTPTLLRLFSTFARYSSLRAPRSPDAGPGPFPEKCGR